MRWKKGLLVVLAFMMTILVNGVGILASERYPDNEDIQILYEGNDPDDSYNYYRVTVKFPAASSSKRETPESLVIFEKDIDTGQIRRAHEVKFEDAGKVLYDKTMKDQSFLAKKDAFYYRAFTAKQNSKDLRSDGESGENSSPQRYEYTCTLTWKDDSSGEPVIRKCKEPLIVKVTKKLSTKTLKYGTANMFGLVEEGQIYTYNGDIYDIDSDTLPKDDIPEANQGNTMYKDEEYGIDQVLPEKDMHINISDEEFNREFSNRFVGNASIQSHVMYTGEKLPNNSKVRFILRNYLSVDNSKELDTEREIPDISEYLTKLATVDMEDIDENMYPKAYFDVYIGMGKGAQGSVTDGDNKNDVSYLFTKPDGTIHEQVGFSIVDEHDNMVPGFMFDFINIKYNPYLFGEYESVVGDGFVKPIGYVMLKSKFNVENNILRPELRLSMNKLLGSESDLTELIDFNEKEINLTIDDIEIPVEFKASEEGANDKELIIKVDEVLSSHFIEELDDINKPGQKVKAFKAGEYEIKMSIPTKLKEGFKIEDYERLVNLAAKDSTERKVYPIDFEIIQYEEALQDREEKLVKVKLEYNIIPYRMPGIN